MKKNGFTLVEILAVLVLIAAITVIAVPSIINYINQSKNKISKATEDLIFSGVDLYLDNNRAKYEENPMKQYCITLNDVVQAGFLEDPIIDAVRDEEVDLNKFVKINYNYDKDLGVYKSKYEITNECTSLTKICRSVTSSEVTTGNIPTTGQYNYGDEYICDLGDGEDRHFFVLEDGDNSALTKGKDKVSLIMNRNIDDTTLAWCGDETLCKVDGNWTNTAGPLTAQAYLESQTSDWTVDVSLPTRDQIYNVNNGMNLKSTKWLYDYLRDTTNSVPGLWGYWTSTPNMSTSNIAYYVRCGGVIFNDYVYHSAGYGVRPVITISKNYL